MFNGWSIENYSVADNSTGLESRGNIKVSIQEGHIPSFMWLCFWCIDDISEPNLKIFC